ncbi:MAG: hypothetical protein RIA69_20490 [Cyclobacteriaceae bacterium]
MRHYSSYVFVLILTVFIFQECKQDTILENQTESPVDSTLFYPKCIPNSGIASFGQGGCWFTLYQYLDEEKSTTFRFLINPEKVLLDSLCRTYDLKADGIDAWVDIKPDPDYRFDFCYDVINEIRPIRIDVDQGTVNISASMNFKGFNEEMANRLLNEGVFYLSAEFTNVKYMLEGKEVVIDHIVFNEQGLFLF